MLTLQQVEEFLRRVDKSFPVPLSHKQDLSVYARKLCEKATLCAVFEGDAVLSLAAGYTDNLTDGRAYIAIVATLPEARGKGYAANVVREFMDICKEKGISAVHLYAVKTNTPAMKMYRSLGFRELKQDNEPRPEDVHLICYFEGLEQ